MTNEKPETVIHNRRATDVTAALWAQVTERSRESAVHSLVVTLLTPYAERLVR